MLRKDDTSPLLDQSQEEKNRQRKLSIYKGMLFCPDGAMTKLEDYILPAQCGAVGGITGMSLTPVVSDVLGIPSIAAGLLGCGVGSLALSGCTLFSCLALSKCQDIVRENIDELEKKPEPVILSK